MFNPQKFTTMKKFWILLLAGGAMTLAPSCEKETKDGPGCPVVCTVPATAEIGGVLTIAGEGFDAAAKIVLVDETTSIETELENPEITASGYSGTVPVTMTPGSYGLTLYQEGVWPLGGFIELKAAADKENPVMSVVLPEAIRLNQTLEIAGLGFAEGMGIVLENTADESRRELSVTLSSSGVSCEIPVGMSAGNYNVILTQGIYEWTLGENIPAAIYKRLAGFSRTLATQYEGVTLEALAKAFIDMSFAASEEEALLYAEAYLPMFEDSEMTVEYSFTYDENGNPKSSTTKGMGAEQASEWFSFTVDGDKISGINNSFEEGTDGMRSFEWTMYNGRVDQTAIAYEKRETEYVWVYDDLGMWTGVNYSSNSPYMNMAYDNGKFLGSEWQTMFAYDAAPQQNAIFGIDIAKFLFSFESINFIEADHLAAICLNLAGQPSLALPSTITDMYETKSNLTYTLDNDGYVTKIEWSAAGGKDMLMGIFDMNNNTSYTLIYE